MFRWVAVMVDGPDEDELEGFRKLYKFSKLLVAGDDPEQLLEGLVETTRAIVEADQAVLFRIEGGQPRIRSVATDAPGHVQSVPDSEIQYSETLVDEVIEREKPLLIRDVGGDPRFEEAPSIEHLAITSAVGAPLYDKGKLIGVIYASRKRLANNFTEHERDLLTVVASQAGLLLSRLATLEALRESESRYRSLVEMSPSAIAVVEDQTLAFANPRACRLWNCDSVAELVGRELTELFDPWRSRELIERVRQGGRFEAVDAWLSAPEVDQGLAVEVVGRPVGDDGEQSGQQLIISEVGAGQELVDERVETDRLKITGEMAATVGHEINNPLSYVYANVDFALEELDHWWNERQTSPDGEIRREVRDGLDSARDGIERIQDVVESLEDLTQLGRSDHQESASVVHPLESSLSMARAQLSEEVDVEVDIGDPPPVGLDATRLGQVFLNVLDNAAQALEEDDGEKPDRLEVRTDSDDEEVVVEIADNGPGIDPEVRSRIFEPFVSTKSGGSGSGLGLAVCRKIVETAGGTIDVETACGEGTTFRLRFPRASAASASTGSEDRDGGREGSVREVAEGKILVVEPEPMLCKSLERVLQGHDVEAVSTKGEAVEWLESDEDFDVVLCELKLRGGLGRDLFEFVERSCPKYWPRLVAMTTGTPGPETRDYLEELPNRWLAKPFDLEELRGVVRTLLEAESSSPEPV